MNDAITAGGLIFCFGRCFHCLLALGENIITIFANRAAASDSLWEDDERISPINMTSIVETA